MEKAPTFEEQLTQLENIVKKLESGTGPLDEMLSLYEQGMQLHDACAKQLDAYEGKIEQLSAKLGEK